LGLLSDKIYRGLTELQKQSEKEYLERKNRTKSLTASTITPTACRRLNWYSLRRVVLDSEKQYDPVVLSKFRDGNDAHEFLKYVFMDISTIKGAEVKVLDEEYGKTFKGIYARVDYMIKLEELGVCDLEFKTGGGNTYGAYISHGLESLPGYYAQAQVIANSKPRRPCIFLMKCKDSSEYEDEIVKPNEEYANKLVKIKEQFDSQMLTDEPPDRGFGYNSDECKGCEFLFRCWFSFIRADTMLERDLSATEKKAVNSLYKSMEDHSEAYGNYVRAERELKDYIAFLHTKHAVSKVRLDGITSSMVNSRTTDVDKEFIRSVLTEEQAEKAFITRPLKFFRTVIR